MTKRKSIYTVMSSHEAALQAAVAEHRIHDMYFPDEIRTELLGSLGSAIKTREAHNFYTDPTDAQEIHGLVRAVMGGNEHVKDAFSVLCELAVGAVQTTDTDLGIARHRLAELSGVREGMK